MKFHVMMREEYSRYGFVEVEAINEDYAYDKANEMRLNASHEIRWEELEVKDSEIAGIQKAREDSSV